MKNNFTLKKTTSRQERSIKEQYRSFAMRTKLLVLLGCIGIFSLPSTTISAQGYIDCATIIADDDNFSTSGIVVEIIDGFTYVTIGAASAGTQQQFPVINNGEAYHNTTGNDENDAYAAIFDPNCNQIFGTYIGGEAEEAPTKINVDANGDIIVLGYTQSADFGTTDGSTLVGTAGTFVRKYALDGTLLFSTIIPVENSDGQSELVLGFK